MTDPSAKAIPGFLIVFFLLVSFCLAAPLFAGEVIIHTQTAFLHAAAGAPCPPDNLFWNEDLMTEDLVSYQATAQVDTFSSCGYAAGSASLSSSIDAQSITVDFSALSELDSHRSSSGSLSFQIDMELTSAVNYTLSATGSYSNDQEPGLTGLSIGLLGVHEIHENRPDFSEYWEGTLGPGNVTLTGGCNSSRSAYYLGGDEWVFETGMAELTGSVTLIFTDAEVVETEDTSLGSVKARFR